MNKKKKICAGCGEETYIYKNIDGEKYCKTCTYRLQPPKQIKKVSEKQVFRIKIKKDLLEEDKKFYQEVWEERFGIFEPMTYTTYPRCECCNRALEFTPNLMYFHHILEKRNYPHYRHSKWNIAIVCAECHNSYESNPDNVPYLKHSRQSLLKSLEEEKNQIIKSHF